MILGLMFTVIPLAKYSQKAALVLFSVFVLLGCKDSLMHDNKVIEMNNTLPPISEDVRQALQIIKEHCFLFGHHSVGENILDGMRTLAKETGVDLKIKKTDAVSLSAKINLVDFSPGKNTNPKSKIDGFVEQIVELNKEFIPELAFLKFCYIDFPPEVNVRDLMEYYKEKMEILKKLNQEIKFAHFTVPLTIRPTGLKSRIKRLLGLQVWGDASNISRATFNNLLFETFPEGPIFDLARIESTRLDGSRAEFTHKGNVYYYLAPELTNDGGHLNALGRRVVASELTLFLANTLKTQQP